MKSSKNLSSAGNQQERSREFLRGYVAGLVDGEGSFHIALQKRSDLPSRISVIPEFHVSQHQSSKRSLELVAKVLGCGYIKPNHHKSRDKTLVYVVRDRADLLTKVIPFFNYNQLHTKKKDDFNIFAQVVKKLADGIHLKPLGLKVIVNLAYKMNNNGERRKITKQELLDSLFSSETIRRIRKKSGKI